MQPGSGCQHRLHQGWNKWLDIIAAVSQLINKPETKHSGIWNRTANNIKTRMDQELNKDKVITSWLINKMNKFISNQWETIETNLNTGNKSKTHAKPTQNKHKIRSPVTQGKIYSPVYQRIVISITSALYQLPDTLIHIFLLASPATCCMKQVSVAIQISLRLVWANRLKKMDWLSAGFITMLIYATRLTCSIFNNELLIFRREVLVPALSREVKLTPSMFSCDWDRKSVV